LADFQKGIVMRPFSCIGIFCDDIREEASGAHTLVGVLPDNVNIPGLPAVIPKLGVYIRIQLENDYTPTTLRARIRIPGGDTFEMADFTDLIGPTREQAEAANTPFAGLISKGTFSPLPIKQSGRIETIVEADGIEYICGVLNFVVSDASSGDTAPPA
jgi:hypothetical protein